MIMIKKYQRHLTRLHRNDECLFLFINTAIITSMAL